MTAFALYLATVILFPVVARYAVLSLWVACLLAYSIVRFLWLRWQIRFATKVERAYNAADRARLERGAR